MTHLLWISAWGGRCYFIYKYLINNLLVNLFYLDWDFMSAGTPKSIINIYLFNLVYVDWESNKFTYWDFIYFIYYQYTATLQTWWFMYGTYWLAHTWSWMPMGDGLCPLTFKVHGILLSKAKSMVRNPQYPPCTPILDPPSWHTSSKDINMNYKIIGVKSKVMV